jgi:nucleolar protein 58
VVSKLIGDARKYKGNPVKVCWFRAYEAAVSNHHLRIAKKELLGSLVRKVKKAYEAEQAELCEKVKLHGESEQIA